MTIIADSAYLKGDVSKLGNNTYRQRDADFSGVVIYFTPKGKFLKSWGYKNGQIMPPAAAITNQTPGVNAIGAQKGTLSNQAPITLNCTYYFWDVTVDGVLVSHEYLYKTCLADDNGGGGGGDGTSTTTQPCTVDTTLKTHAIAGGLKVNGTHDPIGGDPGPGGGDGGFPPPPPTTTGTTTTVNCQQTIDTLFSDTLKRDFPCAKKLVPITLSYYSTAKHFMAK